MDYSDIPIREKVPFAPKTPFIAVTHSSSTCLFNFLQPRGRGANRPEERKAKSNLARYTCSFHSICSWPRHAFLVVYLYTHTHTHTHTSCTDTTASLMSKKAFEKAQKSVHVVGGQVTLAPSSVRAGYRYARGSHIQCTADVKQRNSWSTRVRGASIRASQRRSTPFRGITST